MQVRHLTGGLYSADVRNKTQWLQSQTATRCRTCYFSFTVLYVYCSTGDVSFQLNTCLSVRDLVDEAKDFHLMPERRPHLPAFKTRQRCCTSITGLIYAVGGLNSSGKLYLSPVSVGTVTCVQRADPRSQCVSSCPGDSLNVVEVFDPIGNFWERCQPMRTARSRVGVAVINGLLYAIGGYDGQSRLSTVEVYNPETDTWTQVSSMNSQRRYDTAVLINSSQYSSVLINSS